MLFPAEKYYYDNRRCAFERQSTIIHLSLPKRIATGSKRDCYRVEEDFGEGFAMPMAAKVFRSGASEDLYFETAKAQCMSKEFADNFNVSMSANEHKVSFLSCSVVRIPSLDDTSGFDLLSYRTLGAGGSFTSAVSREGQGSVMFLMEELLDGRIAKYEDNDCVEQSSTVASQPAERPLESLEALSHFAFYQSGETILISGVKGARNGSMMIFTSPRLHTLQGVGLGSGNGGSQYIRRWKQLHRCNDVCRRLRLEGFARCHLDPAHYTEDSITSNPRGAVQNAFMNCTNVKDSKVQSIDDALEQLKAFGTAPEDILGMSPQDYKEFTTSLGWPSYLGPLVRSRLASTSAPPSVRTHQSTVTTKTASNVATVTNEAEELRNLRAKYAALESAELEKTELERLRAKNAELEAAVAATTATKMATVKSAENEEIRRLREQKAALEAAAAVKTATKLATRAELEAMRVKCAKLEEDKAGLAAAAAVGARTKALAAVRKAEEDATFKKISALETKVTAAKKDISKLFLQIAAQGQMEVCFVIDGTGSMNPYIKQVKENINIIADSVSKATKTESRFSLVIYRDYEHTKPIETFPFGTTGDLATALGGLVSTAGKDECEDCFGGLNAAAQMAWSAPARIIIWTGDAPQHGRKYNGGRGDQHPDSTVTCTPIAQQSLKNNLYTVFIPLGATTDAMTRAMTAEFEAVGATFMVVSSGDLVTSIMDILKVVATSTCTTVDRAAGPELLLPLDRFSDYSPERSNIDILVPQSQPKIEGTHPLKALLAGDIRCATEAGRTISLSTLPFARGEVRYAFFCKIRQPPDYFRSWVGKDKRWVAKLPIRTTTKVDLAQIQIQTVARFIAAEFTARVASYPSPLDRPMAFVPMRIMKVGKDHMWLLEPYLDGDYVKFNNNNGAVMREHIEDHPAPQAFTHFSYEYSAGYLLISDIQGVFSDRSGYILTDPAIHTMSPDALPDCTNLGGRGVAAFFKTHECNEICSRLGLRPRTSAVSVVVDDAMSMGSVLADHSMR